MPTLNLVAKLTVDDLLDVVFKLGQAELSEFQTRFEQFWLLQPPPIDHQAADIALKHRFSAPKQAHLHSLLEKNREGDVSEAETVKLDAYIAEIDQSLEATADDLLKLAKQRQQKKHLS